MRRHFIDSSAFIGQSCVDDQYHRDARKISKKLRKEQSIGVTTDFVLSKTLTFLTIRVGHHAAIKFYDSLERAANLIIVYTTQKDFQQAMEIFKQYHDKDFSFVDCISFAIMTKQNLTQAFTFDQHFAQAGFEVVR